MHNVIPDRIEAFLRQHPPFDRFSPADIQAISERAIVRHLTPEERIFQQGEPPQETYYVVFQGAVDIHQDGQLIDRCDDGDIFGARPLVASLPYLATAHAVEESLILCLDAAQTRALLPHNPDVALFLAASFASGQRHPDDSEETHRQPLLPLTGETTADTLFPLQALQHSQSPVTGTPALTVQEAARIMAEKKVGSLIIINDKQHPIGILTDKDLRNRIVATGTPTHVEVGQVMSHPVITAARNQLVADALVLMLRHRIHHLCLTEDGTPASPVIGVISEHDLLVSQGRNPAVLIRDMQRASDAQSLADLRNRADQLAMNYLRQEVSILLVARILTEINDALIQHAWRIAEAELQIEAPTRYTWMGLGSEGRGEQLLRSDQDNALIFVDPGEDHREVVREQFLRLATRVNEIIHQAGFAYCPAEMMARNPQWCLSDQEWKQLFLTWMRSPGEREVMHANIFYDFRPIHGDRSLTEELSRFIFAELENNKIFLALMARDAVKNPPPLGFFRQFIVEKDGAHKDQFDIKLRAMMPLIDAARTLTLYHQQPNLNNTVARFQRLAELEPQQAQLYEQAAEAFELLMRYRAMNGLENQDSGRYFDPRKLSKLERLQLRNSFQPIADLQEVLQVRFQLALINR